MMESPVSRVCGLGITVSTCQLVSGLLSVIGDGISLDDASKINTESIYHPNWKRGLLYTKFLFDCLGYGCSVSSIFLSEKSPAIPRDRIDQFLAVYQLVFRLKDAYKIYKYDKSETTMAAASIESCAGLLTFPIVISSVVLQGMEVASSHNPRYSSSGIVACRGVQLISSCLAQSLTVVKDGSIAAAKADIDLQSKAELWAGAVTVTTVRSLLLLAIPAASFARVVLNHNNQRTGIVYS